jgi:hypothetical protein
MGREHFNAVCGSTVRFGKLGVICLAGLFVFACPAMATTLTFDPGVGTPTDGQPIDQAYGDDVTGNPVHDAPYTYDVSNVGPTPTISVAYGPVANDVRLSLTNSLYGDLTNVIIRGMHNTTTQPGVLEVTLDAFFDSEDVLLYGFDVAGKMGSAESFYNASWVRVIEVNTIQILNGIGTPLWEAPKNANDKVEVPVGELNFGTWTDDPTHASFQFNPTQDGTADNQLTIRIDASNLAANAADIGLDNIVFHQTFVDTPEPGSLGLLALGGLLLTRRRR